MGKHTQHAANPLINGNRVIANQIAWILRLMFGPYTVILLLYVCAIFGFIIMRNYVKSQLLESIGTILLFTMAFLLMYTETLLRKISTEVLVSIHEKSESVRAFDTFVRTTSFIHQVGTFAGIVFISVFSAFTHGNEYHTLVSPILVVVVLHVNMYLYMLIKGIFIYKAVQTTKTSP